MRNFQLNIYNIWLAIVIFCGFVSRPRWHCAVWREFQLACKWKLTLRRGSLPLRLLNLTWLPPGSNSWRSVSWLNCYPSGHSFAEAQLCWSILRPWPARNSSLSRVSVSPNLATVDHSRPICACLNLTIVFLDRHRICIHFCWNQLSALCAVCRSLSPKLITRVSYLHQVHSHISMLLPRVLTSWNFRGLLQRQGNQKTTCSGLSD